MAKRVQLIRYNTTLSDQFIGLQGEVTADITRNELRLHDGILAGGYSLARADLDNVLTATSTNDGKMSASQADVVSKAVQTSGNFTMTGSLTVNGAFVVNNTITTTDDVTIGSSVLGTDGFWDVTDGGATPFGRVTVGTPTRRLSSYDTDYMVLENVIGAFDMMKLSPGGITTNARSTDGGSTWTRYNTGNGAAYARLELDGLIVYSATSGAGTITWDTTFQVNRTNIEYNGADIWYSDATAANLMLYTTAAQTYATTTITSFGRSLIDDASASAARTTLGLVIDTNVQGVDSDVTGYVKGQTVFVSDSTVATGTFAIDTALTASTYETIGPTSSGATNTWAAMNDIPSGAKFCICYIMVKALSGGTTTGDFSQINVSIGYPTGDSSKKVGFVCTVVYDGSGTQSIDQDKSLIFIPLDGSRHIEAYFTSTTQGGGSVDAILEFVGWGE